MEHSTFSRATKGKNTATLRLRLTSLLRNGNRNDGRTQQEYCCGEGFQPQTCGIELLQSNDDDHRCVLIEREPGINTNYSFCEDLSYAQVCQFGTATEYKLLHLFPCKQELATHRQKGNLIYFLFFFHIRPQCVDDFLEFLAWEGSLLHANDSGSIRYDACQSTDNPTKFVVLKIVEDSYLVKPTAAWSHCQLPEEALKSMQVSPRGYRRIQWEDWIQLNDTKALALTIGAGSSYKQRQPTIDFWDRYHKAEPGQEWLLTPEESDLLTSIEKCCLEQDSRNPADTFRILEIGCGTSTLALRLYKHLLPHFQSRLVLVATDVSDVCIRQNEQRDEKVIQESKGRFCYRQMNALDPVEPFMTANQVSVTMGRHESFDLVLDKGCLDTFLFRSAVSVKEELVAQLLDRVFLLLMRQGVYWIVSARPKLKLVRDHDGFEIFAKRKLHANAELDGRSSKNDTVFQYICSKNPSYRPGVDPPCQAYDTLSPSDGCSVCGMTFEEFRARKAHGQKNEQRRWRNHQIHCQGLHSTGNDSSPL